MGCFCFVWKNPIFHGRIKIFKLLWGVLWKGRKSVVSKEISVLNYVNIVDDQLKNKLFVKFFDILLFDEIKESDSVMNVKSDLDSYSYRK